MVRRLLHVGALGGVILPALRPRPAKLVETLRSYDIGEALVYHSVAALINPQEGNARLMAEIAEFPALHPCWVVLPHHTHEVELPEELVSRAPRLWRARGPHLSA